jgi:small subunit ribosomal protein S6
MRTYELVYILDPALEDEQQTALVERFQGLITTQGGEVLHAERWERRRLAYEIKGRREGYYIVVNFRGSPAAEAELDRVLKITDGVIRHLITRMDDRTAAKNVAEAKAAAEAKSRSQAEARAAAEAAAAAAPPAQAAPAPAAPAAPAPPAPEAPPAPPAPPAEAAPAAAAETEGDTTPEPEQEDTGMGTTATGTEE